MDSILIIGASARSAATSASRAGFRVHAIDLFADSDLQRIASTQRIEQNFPRQALSLAEQLRPMPWMFTGGFENHVDLLQEISQSHTLLGTAPKHMDRFAIRPKLADRLPTPIFVFQ